MRNLLVLVVFLVGCAAATDGSSGDAALIPETPDTRPWPVGYWDAISGPSCLGDVTTVVGGFSITGGSFEFADQVSGHNLTSPAATYNVTFDGANMVSDQGPTYTFEKINGSDKFAKLTYNANCIYTFERRAL